jgi:hypothetical protein
MTVTTQHLGVFIRRFDESLLYYEAFPPFGRVAQLGSHVQTINLRRQLGSVGAALASDEFLESLAQTLNAWGVGARDSMLAGSAEFRREMRRMAGEIGRLENVILNIPTMRQPIKSGELFAHST